MPARAPHYGPGQRRRATGAGFSEDVASSKLTMPNADESVPFGTLLRRYRIAAGLTQEALAERTGLGVRSIQHLEGGEHLPHRETVGRLIKGLGISGEERALFERSAQPIPRQRGAHSLPIREVRVNEPEPRHNLPAQLTSFVGRECELAEVGRLFGSTRLLTITGVGGTGKTRLALQFAIGVLDAYADGAWFVDLAPLADPALVPQTVAGAIGVVEQPGEPILATLRRVLRDRQILLIIDNCEHLIDACAQLSDALLRGCPRLQILATSREALGIAGEVAWSLPSLPVPTADWQGTQPDEAIGALNDFAAIQLFVDRAQAAEPGFKVTDQNAAAVVQICRRVDGIPLAIELAAARVKVFSVERIAGRLDDLFRLLTGGSRTALPRQQTLKATIDWSHDLLTEPERLLFRRLSVFVGRFSYEAIEGVCAGDGIEVVDVADLLTRLVDRSLVAVEPEGHERYRLLETLRQYGRDRLVEAGEAEVVRNRHRDWFIALAERAEPELIGPAQGEWLERLEADLANFRAALAWCLDGGGPPGLGLRLAAAVWRLWHVRDHESEGLEWLGRVLAEPGAQERTLTRAKALQGAWELNVLATGYMNAEQKRDAEESLAICQEVGDQAGAAWSMNLLGRQAGEQGDYALADVLLTKALALARETGARWAMAQAIEALGFLAALLGDYARARTRLEESLALFREIGDQRALMGSLRWLGAVALVQGDFQTARLNWNNRLAIAKELRSRVRIGLNLLLLGLLARAEGNSDESRGFFDDSLAISRAIGARWLTALVIASHGWLARTEGNRGRAKALANEALRLSQDLAHQGGMTRCLLLLGVLAIEDGAVHRGTRLLARADAYPVDHEMRVMLLTQDRDACDQSIRAARASLDDDEFARAWAEGQAMSQEQAIALALRDLDPGG